ncbi:hypothetical protein GGC64_006210 [Mycobacterium sp. OAS707]|uniref:hypothetical protein n=1 Tax=Mycobacterium sp. OAS707 TaxID=2663822 RepID=UPI00178BB980|nr:hypothetical protein [Mycobacterium sp. OAS707]MBE1552123.1 hypothetical protein [Mycobacterium sp. OAS707]
MNTNHNSSLRRRKFAAATMLLASSAIAVSALGTAASANARFDTDKLNKFYDCVWHAQQISVPGYDRNALMESCCFSAGGAPRYDEDGNFSECYTGDDAAGRPTTPPKPGTVIAGHPPTNVGGLQ